MSRWIEVEEVKEALKQNTPQYMWGEILTAVNVQPYIDLVRCAECKFWSENTQFCHMFSTKFTAQRMLPNDFCSLGVTKESE